MLGFYDVFYDAVTLSIGKSPFLIMVQWRKKKDSIRGKSVAVAQVFSLGIQKALVSFFIYYLLFYTFWHSDAAVANILWREEGSVITIYICLMFVIQEPDLTHW